MSVSFRVFLFVLMSLALFFGFLHLFVPDGKTYNFERLHIFLFNLCSGGTILLYFTEGKKRPSEKTVIFSVLAISYAVCAFLKIYVPAILIALLLSLIVEMVRIESFQSFQSTFSDILYPSLKNSIRLHSFAFPSALLYQVL